MIMIHFFIYEEYNSDVSILRRQVLTSDCRSQLGTSGNKVFLHAHYMFRIVVLTVLTLNFRYMKKVIKGRNEKVI